MIAFRNMQFGGLVLARVSLLGGGKLNTVDLVTPRSPRFADAVLQRALRGSLDGHPLAVVSPEDFVLLKILSTRDHDLEDARTVVTSLGERLNRDLLISERALLANEIADHPIMDRFVAVLDDRTSPTK
ncbi:MAG: nucleotidyltransferase [Kofleriaceae bacterium]